MTDEPEQSLTNEGTPAHPMSAILKSLVVSTVLLGVSFGIAWLVNLIPVCLLSFGIQWAVFLTHALPNRSEKLFDLTGGITFVLCTSLSLWTAPSHDLLHFVVSGCVIVWALRLSSFLFFRIQRDGKDSRFDKIKPNTLRFWNAWNFQGLWVFLTASPIFIVNLHDKPWRGSFWVQVVGLSLYLIGIIIEIVADAQKSAWNHRYRGQFIDTGLWRYSRHPNYFGEILLWIGLFVACSGELQNWEWISIISPITVTLLLTKVSGIPMVERASDKKWGNDPKYIAYKQKVNLLILGPRR